MTTTLDELAAVGLERGARRTAPRAIRAEAQGPAHLDLYDSIGWPGIEAGEVVAALRTLGARPVVVHLNSSGGDVFQGIAIYNALVKHTAGVTVRVEGLAASIASVIAMAGAPLIAAEASMLMIHEPHAVVIGDAGDMRSMAQLLDKATTVIAEVYRRRVTDEAQVRSWMAAETWFTADEAIKAGLIDAIDAAPVPAAAVAARAKFDLSGYRRVPDAPAKPHPRERERARLLATGFELLVGAGERRPKEGDKS